MTQDSGARQGGVMCEGDPVNHEEAYWEARREIDRLRAEVAELRSDEPGTPGGRLMGISRFAQERGLCSGIEAKPAELFVMEELDRLRAEVAEHQWRDISTAPKDGTLILAASPMLRTTLVRWTKDHKGPAQYMGSLENYAEWERNRGQDGWLSVETPNGWLVSPTIWMPLPAQPGKEE